MQNTILVFTVILFILEFYVYQAFKTISNNSLFKTIYWIITLVIYATILILLLSFNKADRNTIHLQTITTIFVVFILPKLVIIFLLIIDDALRLLQYFIQKITSNSLTHYPERRKFLSIAGIGTFGVLMILLTDGIIFGKYRHKVRKVKLKIANLPNSFKGYKIVQISDLHLGSFSNPEHLKDAIQIIQHQKADLIVSTGDTVNNYADEFKPFIDLFKSLEAKDGKFSVLGNHDYGDYGHWPSKEEKAKNIPNLIDYKLQSGFITLRNENHVISKNGENIYLVGVENWGELPFPQFGDLDKAVSGIPTESVKILLSHDPTHFEHKVKNHPVNIQLTLSGHTHGMQFGIDLKNIKWSPVQYRYKRWVDLYESNSKYLYVNRGFGVIGFPGRVGINPEITVFELHPK